MQTVDVLGRIDAAEDREFVQPGRLLDQERRARRVCVELVHDGLHLGLLVPAGSSRWRLAMPSSAQSRCLAVTYQRLAGSSPTRTVPSPGDAPAAQGVDPRAKFGLDRGESRPAVQDPRRHEGS